MTRPSRRKVLAAALAAPLAATQAAGATAEVGPPDSSDHLLMANAAKWAIMDQALTAMERDWQDLETRLFQKAALLQVGCDAATRGDLPEAIRMQELDVLITAAYGELENGARDVGLISARTAAGAIAKIELGLKVQGGYDWKVGALELIVGGIFDLRAIG